VGGGGGDGPGRRPTRLSQLTGGARGGYVFELPGSSGSDEEGGGGIPGQRGR
jgi:hypothetical protein